MRRLGFPIKTPLLQLLLTAALAGCQATQYQPLAPAGGFGEVQLDGNLWRIRYMHNAFTTRETAQSYWLYRAAELTMSRGYDGFEVLSQSARTRSSGAALSSSSAFYLEGEIRMIKKPFESVPPKTYNAEALRAVLSPYVASLESEPSVAMRIETPPSSPEALKLRMTYSMPCAESPGQAGCPGEATRPAPKPAAAAVARPAPAPRVARPQAPPVSAAEPRMKPTGPCEVKPVMTDQDLINCGARVR